MARKSKGKFNMKGHSIPGIKGFKGTTLEDGRAASSAFQMQSPFLDHETDMDEESDTYGQVIVHDDTDDTDDTDGTTTDDNTGDNTDVEVNPYEHGMDWSKIQKTEYLANRAKALAAGQDPKAWAMSEIAKAIKRKKANKARKAGDTTDTTDTTSDDTTGEIVDINNDGIPDGDQPDLFNEDGSLKEVEEKKDQIDSKDLENKIVEDKTENKDKEVVEARTPYTRADLKNLPQGSEERKQAYDDLNWAYDETIDKSHKKGVVKNAVTKTKIMKKLLDKVEKKNNKEIVVNPKYKKVEPSHYNAGGGASFNQVPIVTE